MSNWTAEDLSEHYERLKQRPPELAGNDTQKPVDVPEEVIEAECTKILEEDSWRALRTDPVSDRGRGKGFGELGMADHLYIRYLPQPEILWIEFKRPGEKAKKHQTQWHIRERARGALTLIAGEDFPASVVGFREWYDTSGLRRVSW